MAQINEDLETLKTARDNMKTALGNKGQIVNNDIRTYASAITNIPSGSGSGDVKLFDTVEHMQADTDAQEGDLAVVYRDEMQPITEESEFDSCTFPNTVVLDEAFTDNIYGRFMATGSDYFDGMVDMSSTAFSFDGWGESGNVNVQYTSSDGITYTRTDGGEELQEFGTVIKWQDYGEEFNDVIGNFMKIGGNYFEGLYEYKTIDDENYCNGFTNFNILEQTFEQSKVSIQSLYTAYDLVNNYDNNTIMNALTEIVDVNNINFYTYNSSNSSYYYAYLFTTAKYDGVNKYFISRSNGASTNVYTMYRYSVNLTNNTVTKTQLPLTSISNIISYWNSEIDISHIWLNYNFEMGKPTNQIQFSGRLTETTVTNSAWTIHTNKPTKTLYNITSTQLDAVSDYVYEKTFYGKNGVESGTLGIPDNSFADASAAVYTKVKKSYDVMTPRVLTDSDKDINKNIYVVPSNANGVSLLDTSSVTNMDSLFQDCKNLSEISSLNTSNATSMHSMFLGCSSLITIPQLNTSSVTNMTQMFYECSSLTTIPLLNTPNVTRMYYMFLGCSSLIIIPQLNTSHVTDMFGMFSSCTSLTSIPQLDTSSVTQMRAMFYGCSSLTTIPQLDISSVTNINNFTSVFDGCTSLSNESLNNILYMCAHSAITTTSKKTLKTVGLTQAQATTCQSLSNYSAFTSAGWTTGY